MPRLWPCCYLQASYLTLLRYTPRWLNYLSFPWKIFADIGMVQHHLCVPIVSFLDLTDILFIAYTSMYKKLQDPTACRLENFWWHVWGSDKRNLSGKTLATLWKEIASGPTFVPLMAPTGRHNGPPVGKPEDIPQPHLWLTPNCIEAPHSKFKRGRKDRVVVPDTRTESAAG